MERTESEMSEAKITNIEIMHRGARYRLAKAIGRDGADMWYMMTIGLDPGDPRKDHITGPTWLPISPKSVPEEVRQIVVDQERRWLDGYLASLWDFAWHHNGVLVVGSGIKTYREAKEHREQLFERDKQNGKV